MCLLIYFGMLTTLAMEMGIQMLKDVEANYPERLKVGYAINGKESCELTYIIRLIKPDMYTSLYF